LETNWNIDCEGDRDRCSFLSATENIEVIPEPIQEEKPQPKKEFKGTKISIHKIENPYAVKADVLIFPANNVLQIDDAKFHRLSRGKIQQECDAFPKPIKMGHVYITSNGGDESQVKPKSIYHAVVAGESRLVNEEDIRSSMRKSLHLAESNNAGNIVILPCDCGTHDIEDTARVQLSSILTYFKSKKDSNIRNVFIVMEDEESYKTFEEYYNRIF
jgi:O-acetyl-ADP-ribose deacetylase (regulator of RNase III)